MPNLKDHSITVSISTVATMIPVFAAIWFVMQPLLIAEISDELAEEFDQQIEQKAAPVQNAFKVLLKSNIDKLKKEIARLETHEDDEDWGEEDAEYLTELEIELEAFQGAYEEL